MREGWSRALVLPITILAWLAVLGVLGWLLGHVAKTLLMVVLATVIAFAVTPAVNLLSRRLPRVAALAITYVAALVVLVALVGVVAYTVGTQLASLVANLPRYAKSVENLQPQALGVLSRFGVTGAQLDQLRASAVLQAQSLGGRAASDALGFAKAFLGGVIDGVLILMLSIYLAANGPALRKGLHDFAPKGQGVRARILTNTVNRVVGGYVRGTLTLALLIGILVGVGMGVLGVRYALLLGVLAFFMEFIPILGVFVSGGLCVAVALFQGWQLALIVLAYFVVVHIIEGDVIGPRIMGAAVGIHPAVALVALLAGTELFGLWGALFGAPVAGLLQAIVVVAWREARTISREPAEPAVSPAEAAVSVKQVPVPRRSRP